ncbi:MAG: S46 family peptidase [Pyrinomonadaceae bacterium]|nr:S46 family peptidase [Pyrinomonadaceae bacterium]
MDMRKFLSLSLALLFLASTLMTSVRADEGMWPFNNVPRAEIKRRYNFDVTDAWLRKVQMSSVRFNSGGSGSFVSADGLVLTNHHVAADTLQKISTQGKDYIKEGFLAPTRAAEIKAPDLELNVLMSIEDVTSRVNASVKPDTPAAEANTARRAAIAQIEKNSTEQTKLRSDVVTLYQGGQYNLYRYKKYTDVRLVFAPEFEIAFFGGDPDNFTYPRYCLDMALFRVYENDKPVRVENYLKWSTAGAKDGELVFVSGHPASTERLNTMAHLEYLRDTGLPLTLKYLERNQTFLKEYMRGGEEQARRAQEEFFGVENSLKAFRGRYEGLRDQALMRKKQQSEQALRQQISADPRKQKEYGDAFDQIARARQALPSYERQRRFTESAWGLSSSLFNIARSLVRLADESAKPNAERLPEYADARRASLELSLYSPAPIYEDFEKMKLVNSLRFMIDELGANNPLVVKILNGKTPEARAAELVDGTKLKDVAFRRTLAQGGKDAIQKSDDPMIALARSIDAESRAARKRYEDEVTGVERAAYAKIARALFETQGTSLYPDATFTLRLSYGAVKGYTENGKQIPPFTTLGGAFQHAMEHNSQTPYQLPASWLKNKSQLNLNTPLNFVSSNDIIGGNSGSPVINRNAELVGLIFDGNIQSLVGNFVYDESVNRAVSVDSRGMLEALRKIYNANELVAELTR